MARMIESCHLLGSTRSALIAHSMRAGRHSHFLIDPRLALRWAVVRCKAHSFVDDYKEHSIRALGCTMIRFMQKSHVLTIVFLPIASATMAGLALANSLENQITLFLLTIVPFFPVWLWVFFSRRVRVQRPHGGLWLPACVAAWSAAACLMLAKFYEKTLGAPIIGPFLYPLILLVIGFAAIAIDLASICLFRPTLPREWQCPHCGYDLRGLSAVECPECGKKAPKSLARNPQPPLDE